jgi:hypothetical protein
MTWHTSFLGLAIRPRHMLLMNGFQPVNWLKLPVSWRSWLYAGDHGFSLLISSQEQGGLCRHLLMVKRGKNNGFLYIFLTPSLCVPNLIHATLQNMGLDERF